MMQTMVLRVLLQEVAENIQNVDFYLIMCNEATDVKNISELVVCLRWVDNEMEAHDVFIGLKNMPNIDADLIVRELEVVLWRMHLKLKKIKRTVLWRIFHYFWFKERSWTCIIYQLLRTFSQSCRRRHEESMPFF